MNDKKEIRTLLVTAVGSFSAQAVIARYREEGYRVLGCDIYPAEWIAASAEVDRFFQAPYASDPSYLPFLEKVCREERVDALIPLTDPEVDVLNHWREQADALGVILCISGQNTVSLCRNKWRLERFLDPLAVCRTIPGRVLSQVIGQGAENGYEKLPYPLVIKPFDGRSSQGLTRVADEKAMRNAVRQYGENAASCLVQPQIPGTIVTVDVVRNPETGQVECLPRRELLRTPSGAGTSVCVFRSPELERQCAAVAEALDIRGCVNFEFVEQESGTWYFLECNPRFSGGVAFSCMAGYDMVGNHLRCFMGEELEPMGEIPSQYLVKRYQEYRMKVE